MDVTVAIGAERDQILVCVVAQPAPRANVVDLKTIGTTAGTGIASRHAPTLRCGVCDKNLASAEVSVVAAGNHSLNSLNLLHEFRFSVDPEAMNKVDRVRRAVSRNYHPRGELRQGNRHKSSLSNSRGICSRRASAPPFQALAQSPAVGSYRV